MASQIADALAAAHGAAIVHRDLKPGNVMLGANGTVKVLDFGLAKLAERKSIAVDDATLTVKPNTESGTVMGTVSYMSPEQASGGEVDARSDIFSFGSVLYEMLTGRRAFHRETGAETMTAVIREEPKAAGSLVEGLPAKVTWVLERCMRKSVGKRWQTMADLKVAVEEMLGESESGIFAAQALPTTAKSSRWPWLAAAVGSGRGDRRDGVVGAGNQAESECAGQARAADELRGDGTRADVFSRRHADGVRLGRRAGRHV